jgi:hypothetical protein
MTVTPVDPLGTLGSSTNKPSVVSSTTLSVGPMRGPTPNPTSNSNPNPNPCVAPMGPPTLQAPSISPSKSVTPNPNPNSSTLPSVPIFAIPMRKENYLQSLSKNIETCAEKNMETEIKTTVEKNEEMKQEKEEEKEKGQGIESIARQVVNIEQENKPEPVILDKKSLKKRNREVETAQMQSLSSFMKFAEEEKRKNDLEEVLRLLREENGEENGGGNGGDNSLGLARRGDENGSLNKPQGLDKDKKRSTDEFTSNSFEMGKESLEEKKKKKKSIGPQGPSNFSASTDTSNDDINNESNNNKNKKQKKLDPTISVGSTLEGGDAVWIPPKNQTGDGKTSLNAKLGY